jgi:hypothetical protein
MQKVNSSWGRMILAFVAVLAVAGPGMVFASGPKAGYPAPKYAVIEGTFTVAGGGGTDVASLYVTYVDGSTATLGSPPVVFSATNGSFSGANYTPPAGAVAGTTRDLLKASYSSQGVTVTANRVVTLQ